MILHKFLFSIYCQNGNKVQHSLKSYFFIIDLVVVDLIRYTVHKSIFSYGSIYIYINQWQRLIAQICIYTNVGNSFIKCHSIYYWGVVKMLLKVWILMFQTIIFFMMWIQQYIHSFMLFKLANMRGRRYINYWLFEFWNSLVLFGEVF